MAMGNDPMQLQDLRCLVELQPRGTMKVYPHAFSDCQDKQPQAFSPDPIHCRTPDQDCVGLAADC